MTDTTPTTDAPAPPTPDPSDTPAPSDTEDDGKDWKAEADKWRGLARKHEDKAKANSSAATELEKLRQSAMSEQEKAVAQARDEGRALGRAEGSAKVAAAEIRAAAAGRMTAEQLEALLEATNLAVFIGDDGEVDAAKVSKFVDGIAPKDEGREPPTRQFPDLGQGARGGNQNAALNGDPLLRDLKAHLGIR